MIMSIILGGIISSGAYCAPLRATPSFVLGGASDLLPIDDSCLWWGTRWQYGWRGYGWYGCWEVTTPFPTVIAPEAIPPEAIEPGPPAQCTKRWRDDGGRWHVRRVC
jgi:hypothetical protein